MAVSGTLDATAYNGEMQSVRATLGNRATDNAVLGNAYRHLELRSVTSTTALVERSLIWLAADDHPIKALILQARAASGSANIVNATLEAITDGGTVIERLLPSGKVQARDTAVGTSNSDVRVLEADLIGAALLGGTVYRLSLQMETASVTLDLARAVLVYGQAVRR